MANSRPFVPGFMKKIDRFLLLNQPTAWSMRTHLVLFFGACFAAVLTLLCTLLYADARQYSGVEIMTGFVIVIAAVGLIFWLIYLLRFNVFKRYGEWKTGDGLKIFFLLLINVSVFIAIPFIPAVTESFMAGRQFSDKELVSDINEINTDITALEYKPDAKPWRKIGLVIASYTSNAIDGELANGTIKDDSVSYQNRKYPITPNDLQARIDAGDSIVSDQKDHYILYQSPAFNYLSLYDLNNGDNRILFNKDIFSAARAKLKKEDRQAIAQHLKDLQAKYKSPQSDYYNGYDSGAANEEYYTIENRYNVYAMQGTMEMILRKKNYWSGASSWALRVLYYCTLFFTLLIFIFRHTTVKTFFLTALTAIVLAIITGLFVAIADARETGIFMIMVIYFLIFTLISLSIFNAPVRSLWRGISLNLFMFALPVMPLIVTAYYWFTNKRGYIEGNTYATVEMRDRYFLYSEIAGFVLLVILIEPLFRRLYRAWYASPEE